MFGGQDIETLGQGAVFLLIFSFFLMIGIFSLLLWVGWWVGKQKGSPCPYTKKPLKMGVDIAHSVRRIVNDYIYCQPQPENEPIDFDKAAICADTGRIFRDCVRKGEIVKLDWSFIQKQHPGKFISWGSLSEYERGVIRMCHESMEGFQTEQSSPHALPEHIGSVLALTKPGPLYVDRQTKVLVGWKEVPNTHFEILVVQKPLYQSIEETL